MRRRATRRATTTNSSTATASGTTNRITGACGCRRTPTGVMTRSATAIGSASDSAGAGSIPRPGASSRSTAGAGRICMTGIAGAGCRSGIITRDKSRRTRGRSDIPAMKRARATTDATSPSDCGRETMISAGLLRPSARHDRRTMAHGAKQHRGASGGIRIRRGAMPRIRGTEWRRCGPPTGPVLLPRAARREQTPRHRQAVHSGRAGFPEGHGCSRIPTGAFHSEVRSRHATIPRRVTRGFPAAVLDGRSISFGMSEPLLLGRLVGAGAPVGTSPS